MDSWCIYCPTSHSNLSFFMAGISKGIPKSSQSPNKVPGTEHRVQQPPASVEHSVSHGLYPCSWYSEVPGHFTFCTLTSARLCRNPPCCLLLKILQVTVRVHFFCEVIPSCDRASCFPCVSNTMLHTDHTKLIINFCKTFFPICLHFSYRLYVAHSELKEPNTGLGRWQIFYRCS